MRVVSFIGMRASGVRRYAVVLILAMISMMATAGISNADTGPCGAGSNPIVCEN